MNKILKVICGVACAFVFCFLAIGYATIQDELSVNGSVTVIPPNKVFAVYGETFDLNGDSTGMALNFYNRSMPELGETIDLINDNGMKYGSLAVTEIYEGFDTETYTANTQLPWYQKNIASVTVVDEGIAPVSTAYWFSNIATLNSAELSKLDTKNTTDMNNMFSECAGLLQLDLSSFDTGNVTNMSAMFSGCTSLSKIIVSDKWNISSLNDSSADMFLSSDVLTGGAGTTLDSNIVDKTYARVDGGTKAPGYLTYYNYALVFEPNFSTTTTSGTVVNVPNMKIGDDQTFDIAANDVATHTWAEFLGWSTDNRAKAPTFLAGQSTITIDGAPPQGSTLYAVWKCVVHSDEQIKEILANGTSSKTYNDYTVAPGTYGRLITARGNTVIVESEVVLTNASHTSANSVAVNSGGKLIIEYIDDTQTSDRGAVVNAQNGTVQIKDGKYAKQYICMGSSSGTVQITGGNFTISVGFIMDDGYGFIFGLPTLIITGGTFSKDPSEYVPEGYLARDNGDGTWTVVCKHPGAEFTITPTRHSGTCSICGEFDEKHIFDDNGLCLVCGHQTIANNEQLTAAIAEGKGTPENPLIIGTGEWSNLNNLSDKTIVIEDGYFNNFQSVFCLNTIFTIKGGVFEGSLLFYTDSDSQGNTLNIHGGIFTSTNPFHNQCDRLYVTVYAGTFYVNPEEYSIQGGVNTFKVHETSSVIENGDGTWTVVPDTTQP